MAKTLTTAAKETAKAGTQGMTKIAVEALGAAAVAAAGVVLTRTAQALASGASNVEKAKPAAETAVLRAVAPSRGKAKAATTKKAAKSARKKSARKAARKKTSRKAKTASRRKKARR